MSKQTVITILKVVAAIVAAVLSVLTVSSCSVSHSVTCSGKATIITTDTTTIFHNGAVSFDKYK